MNKTRYSSFAAIIVGTILSIGHANACTISSDMMRDTLPINSAEIPTKDRVKIADMVISARRWTEALPGIDISGEINAGAYVGENNPKALAEDRASRLKEFLVQLGIKNENIWSSTRLIPEEYAFHDGKWDAQQISVILYPLCEGGCAQLCNSPNVMPTTKAGGSLIKQHKE